MMQPAHVLKHVKRDDNATLNKRLDELDLANEMVVTNHVPVDFVFIGDSITRNWELNAYFGSGGKVVLNRGIGGDTTGGVAERFGIDVLQLKPRYAVLEAGVNDTWAIEAFSTDMACRENPMRVVERITGNIRSILQYAKEQGQQIILCSIPPTCEIGWAPRTAERNEVIAAANDILRGTARQDGIPFADYHREMTEPDGKTMQHSLTHDGLHPHVIGYNIMAEVLKRCLNQNGIRI